MKEQYKLIRYGVVEGTPKYMEEMFNTLDKAKGALIVVANELKEYYNIPLNETEYQDKEGDIVFNQYVDLIEEGNYIDNTRMTYEIVKVGK